MIGLLILEGGREVVRVASIVTVKFAVNAIIAG
jgi:hypothetical protein